MSKVDNILDTTDDVLRALARLETPQQAATVLALVLARLGAHGADVGAAMRLASAAASLP
jgi:hypothetical protein